MKELSLHILDIVQNSISAGASLVEIEIIQNTNKDEFILQIEDNGHGIDKEMLRKIKDPFFTTRTTRKIGLGIPLLKAAAERCKGELSIESEVGKGTKVIASFIDSNIDRAPLGNMWDTLAGLIICSEKIDFVYKHSYNEKIFMLDTREIKKTLQEVPITSPDVLEWIREYIKEGIKNIMEV